MGIHTASTTLETRQVGDRRIDVAGVYDSETPEDEYEWYDIFDAATGECLNMGEPFYEYPSDNRIAEYLKSQQEVA